MNQHQYAVAKFAESLATESPLPCDLKVGDEVIIRNAYGLVIDKGYKVIGFEPKDSLSERNEFIYLDWDCYWFPKASKDVWKKADLPITAFRAFAYSSASKPPSPRQFDLIDYSKSPMTALEMQFLTDSAVIGAWHQRWDIHNIMAQFYAQKHREAADEPDYYMDDWIFNRDSTVVLSLQDVEKLEQYGDLFSEFISVAKAEIAQGKTVYYRAF